MVSSLHGFYEVTLLYSIHYHNINGITNLLTLVQLFHGRCMHLHIYAKQLLMNQSLNLHSILQQIPFQIMLHSDLHLLCSEGMQE